MPRKNVVDAAKAVAMHRDEGLSSLEIAKAMGVQPPAIFRAFRKQGYFTDRMAECRQRHKAAARQRALLPPDPVHNAKPWACARGPEMPPAPVAPPSRDPCPRCQVRGDIGCKHNTARLGWHVG